MRRWTWVLWAGGCAEPAGVSALDTGSGALPPPGVVFDQSALVPGQPVTFRVQGVAPGDRVYFARSLDGVGAGPCFPNLGNVCLGILQPTLIGSDRADNTGEASVTFTLPTPLPPVFVYTQAVVDSFAGVVTTNTITAPVLRGALDDDGDGFCEGNTCHDRAVLPGDCADDNDEVYPGQTQFFDVGYNTPNGRSFDFDCDGTEEPYSTDVYRCTAGGAAPLCQSHRDGWSTRNPPACGVAGDWESGCIALPFPLPGIGLCASTLVSSVTMACR